MFLWRADALKAKNKGAGLGLMEQGKKSGKGGASGFAVPKHWAPAGNVERVRNRGSAIGNPCSVRGRWK